MLPRWLIGFRALALACAFAAAFVPIATYITDDKRGWLWIHIGVNIAAYISVALTTIYTTISLTQQDHNKYHIPAYWANNVIMRTWYLGVSKTWRWHVAAAVGRLGLALALAQHLHIIRQVFGQDFEGILGPFLYSSHGMGTRIIFLFSQWETVIIGAAALFGFAYVETALLSALAVVGYLFKGDRVRAVLIAIALRAAIVVICVGVMLSVHTLFNPRIEGKEHRVYQHYHLYAAQIPLKDLHKIAFTWLDDGTMLASWMMRPVGGDSYHTCLKGFTGTCHEYDNRASVAIDVVHGLLAILSYLFVIGGGLQLAQYLHWRREPMLIPSSSSTTV